MNVVRPAVIPSSVYPYTEQDDANYDVTSNTCNGRAGDIPCEANTPGGDSAAEQELDPETTP